MSQVTLLVFSLSLNDIMYLMMLWFLMSFPYYKYVKTLNHIRMIYITIAVLLYLLGAFLVGFKTIVL